MPKKSPVVAKDLGITYPHLMSLIRYGKVAAPAKDTSGDYVWNEQDIAKARAALRQRRVKQAS